LPPCITAALGDDDVLSVTARRGAALDALAGYQIERLHEKPLIVFQFRHNRQSLLIKRDMDTGLPGLAVRDLLELFRRRGNALRTVRNPWSD
jgi:hypothetical protein